MRYLLDEWTNVARRFKAAEYILLLIDYDGTLTPIVNRPELAVLSSDTRKLLRKLAKNRHYIIGIISGRALSDLKSKIGLDDLIYAGNHGLEIEGLGSSFLEPVAAEMQPLFDMLHRALSATTRSIRGVFVENKGLTLSVHYRMAEAKEEDKVKDVFQKVTDPLHVTGRIRITQGKKVYEIRPPVDWNKGKAVTWLMAKLKDSSKKRRILPVYLGDDLTDEDAFNVVNKIHGISIVVGEDNIDSVAQYFLKSPEEVTYFLKML
ncbi:MAG TPA: trehalose-phosphatase [Dehalococcoidia bacterium]|jgi:trehalose-phosphatase